jgi:hypothetical protein
VKIALAEAHFHGFGVALAGPWNTVEKIISGLTHELKSASDAPKTPISEPNRGPEAGAAEFFNSLAV